jgi:AcrR family transcriptional regulator
VPSHTAKELLIDAAERLIAERGIDVSLNDIAAAAGQRNKSAVQYHFGSRDGLVRAVIEERLRPLEKRRLELLAQHEAAGRPDDVAELITILVAPMLDIPSSEGATHYARFLHTVRSHPALSDVDQLDPSDEPAVRIIVGKLSAALAHVPLATRQRRLHAMATAMFALLADDERRRNGAPMSRQRATAAAADIARMLAGLVTAPA